MTEFFSLVDVQKTITNKVPEPAHRVPIDQLVRMIEYRWEREPEKKHIAFIVIESRTGKVLDPKEFCLYAEGLDYDGNIGMLEKFPPGIWP